MKDILLNIDTDDLNFENGDFAIGDSDTQDVSIIIRASKGELKRDVVLGADLIKLVNSNTDKYEIENQIRLHLERDNKDYELLKNRIQINEDN